MILAYIQRNETIQHVIENGRNRLKAKALEDKLIKNVNFIKLDPGNAFGDFEEAKGKTFKSQCVVSMSEPLKCLVINNSDLIRLFAKSLAPENLALIRSSLNQEDISG